MLLGFLFMLCPVGTGVALIRRHARAADLVHCTGWDATLWGRLAALFARRPAGEA